MPGICSNDLRVRLSDGLKWAGPLVDPGSQTTGGRLMSALAAGGTADKEVTDLYSATNLLGRARALAPKLRERSYATNKAGQIPAETIEDFWDFKLKIYYGRENSAARQCVPM